MAVWNENAKELLSGYLDGELTSQEIAYVEELLQECEEARQELQLLKSMRQVLQNQPTLCLPHDFSAKVIQAAQRRAVSMGKDQPVWLGGEKVELSQPVSNSVSAIANSRRSRPWIWGLVATAAAIGLILFSLTKNQGQIGGQGLIGKVDQPSETIEPIPGIDTDRVENQGSSVAQSDRPLEQPREPIGVTEAQSSQVAVNEPSDNSAMESAQSKESLDSNATSLAQTAPKAENLGLSESDVAQLKQFEDLLKAKSFMFILDFTVAKEAWEGNFLGELMARNDIAYDSPAVIDETLLEQLKQSRFIGPTNGLKAPDQSVALVFMKGRASRLERVAAEIAVNIRDFPEFAFDMSGDLAIQHGLSGIREFRELPDNREAARSLASSNAVSENGLTMFASPDRKRTLIAPDRRSAWNAPSEFDDTMNPVSYTLLIIRPLLAK